MLHLLATQLAGKLRLVAMVFALAVAGGTGTAVALTAANGPSHPAAVQPSESESPDPSESPEPSETPEPREIEPADHEANDQGDDNGNDPTQSPKPSATPCPGGLSHGEFVSKVAQDAPTGEDSEHGKTVSEAAHMDCGKGDDGNENEGADDQGEHRDNSGPSHEGDNSGPGNSSDDPGDSHGSGDRHGDDSGGHGGHGGND
jgi:hypothetical protein